MNYEERYNVALERARELSKTVTGANYEYIFPELKESEGERIRKELIEFLKLPHSQFVGNREHEKWIAWLEKQCEQKETWEPNAAQLIVIKDLIEDKNTSRVNKTILRDMLDDVKQLINSRKREIDDAYLQGICDAKHEIEKQGEQTQFDYEHADITQKDFAPIEPKMLNADEVIAWLEKHIIEWKGQDLIKTFTPNSPAGKSYIVEQFKEDFGL